MKVRILGNNFFVRIRYEFFNGDDTKIIGNSTSGSIPYDDS